MLTYFTRFSSRNSFNFLTGIGNPFVGFPIAHYACETENQVARLLCCGPPCYARPMPDIVLTTLNAKYIHAAFGLRYLMANLGALRERARIVEFDINQRAVDVAEVLLAQNPKIIGLGVYIWNAAPATEVVAALKRIRPDVTVILGGPEVSYETEQQEIVRLADHVITGEADLKFAEVCEQLLGAANLPVGLDARWHVP